MTNVLVVEDDTKLANVLEEKLTKTGFYVSVCHNGQEGLDKLKVEKFNIVLLDLLMPIKDGYEFLESYLNITHYFLPIIVLTNLSEFSSKMKVFKRGVISYMVKADVSMEDIVDKIKELAR